MNIQIQIFIDIRVDGKPNNLIQWAKRFLKNKDTLVRPIQWI